MSNFFLITRKDKFSYTRLLNDLNAKLSYNNILFVKDNEPYEIFLNLIHSIIYDYPIELVDGDFSEEEIENTGISIEKLKTDELIRTPYLIDSISDLYEIIRTKTNNLWSISLFTSGTTGIPKKITHTLDRITRNVKCNSKFENNTWGFAYNPTHMAGIQVFLQAFLNKNTIIYLFGEPNNYAKDAIINWSITNISATSTYYKRLLASFKNDTASSVHVATFGGEKCDSKTISQINGIFPNAKIRNIYASTEAGSLFTSKGEAFLIPQEIQDYIKINDSNELLIHKSLLGHSNSFTLIDNWYNTKDLVELLNDNSFKFIARKSDLINIGGYQVNPLEVEEILSSIDGIVDISIYPRKNSVTGNIIMADIVSNNKLNDSDFKKIILEYANNSLQSWKVPRIINFVDDISKTRTGKKVR